MKTILNRIIIVVVAMLLVACSNIKHNPLGNIPSLAKSSTDKIEKYNQKRLELNDNQKTIEYQQKIREVSQKAKKKIQDAFARMEKPVNIPFAQDAYKGSYQLDGVIVTGADFNQIHMEAYCTVIDTTLYNYIAYAKFVDENDKLLPGWATFMSYRDSIIDIHQVKLYCTYHHLENLVDMKGIKTFDNEYFKTHQE